MTAHILSRDLKTSRYLHYTEQIEQLKIRLQQPLPGNGAQNKMAGLRRKLPLDVPEKARQSAVLGLLYPIKELLHLLLIRRVEDGKAHGGQISFPGGRRDSGDNSLQDTALRETFEEVGIPSEKIEVIGALTSLYIPVSNSNVQPYIGFSSEQPDCIINKHEVQYILEVPVTELFNPDIKTIREIRPSSMPEITIKAPAYQWNDNHTIWGATAMMIAELEEVMYTLL